MGMVREIRIRGDGCFSISIDRNRTRFFLSILIIIKQQKESMKHPEIESVESLTESIERSQKKINSLHSLIKQICSPQAVDWDQASEALKDVLAQKKIVNSNPDSSNTVQKTVKIKKGKRKQKKKAISPSKDPSLQKNFTPEICRCCSGKLECTPTHDGYESEDEYYGDSHIQNIIESIGQELLECFYDEIDKSIIRIMKDAGSQHSRTFMRLMRKLADIFEDYDEEFKDEIERELEGETLAAMETGWTVCQQFKNYVFGRFPLLKDFIENFKLTELDDKQMEEITKLQLKNPLIQSIYIHMQQIAAKRSKKKNKRQLQKLNKKSIQIINLINPPQSLNSQNEDIIERLRNLKIKQKERTACFFDYERLNKIKHELAYDR